MKISDKFARVSPSPTLAIDSKFKEMKANGMNVVGFGAGEPDFDTPKYIKEAAIAAINNGMTKYTPASGTLALKKAICKKFERDNGLIYNTDNIVISNGAKHSLVNALGAILNPGDEVIIPAPYWVSYSQMVELNDGVSVIVKSSEEENFLASAEKIEKAITKKTKAIIINSPSNPTGMIYDESELRKIADIAVKYDLYIISDEIYEHLIYDGKKHISIASFGEEIKKRTIVINGVSKTYAMTGWRIGYLACAKEIAKAISSVQSHETSNPNSIAQEASRVALEGGKEEISKMVSEFSKRRLHMIERISKIKYVSCIKPSGAFYVMMNIKGLYGKKCNGKVINSSDDFAELFLEKELVAVVPGTGFCAPGYVRWSYATSIENIDEGMNRLEKFIDSLE